MARNARSNPHADAASASSSKAAASSASSPDSTSKPKRVRRKCKAPNCDNRVVQGGVCVTHGAKRKLCAHDGCSKAVKLAGFCSTHGPARRKCDTGGCDRVAVQGGKCLSHGARRKVCSYPLSSKGGEKCSKNAIMMGMCKKHYDRVREAEGMLEMSLCVPVNVASAAAAASSSASVGGSAYGCGSAMAMSGVESEGESVLSSTPSWDSSGAAVARTTSAMEGWRGVSQQHHASAALAPSYNNDATVHRAKKMKPSPHFPRVFSQPVLSTPSWSGSGVPASASFGDEGIPLPPLAEQPPHHECAVTVMSSTNGHQHRHQRAAKKMPSHHKRGLSIFDEMLTVDAIISSGAENQTQPPPQQQQPNAPLFQNPMPQVKVSPLVAPPPSDAAKVATAPPAPWHPKFKYNSNMSTKTPTPQVSFADCVPRNKNSTAVAAPPTRGESPCCTGNSSCTCKACRSPTLAIFEQMIQASQKIEREEFDPAKYAGLSAPKLSPRKSSAAVRDSFADGVETPTMTTSTPKNVSFLPPEEPSSSGSVVRKVSSNNIVGEGSGWDRNAAAASQQSAAVRFPQDQARQDYYQGYAPQEAAGARAGAAGGSHEEGPASHALDTIAHIDADGVSRAVSHDVDDGRYHPSGHYLHHGPPLPHGYPPQYSHHGQAPHYASRAPPYPHDSYPHNQDPPPQGPPPRAGGYSHNQPPPPHDPPPHAAPYHYQNFQAPLTPALYDADDPNSSGHHLQEQSMAVVSSHSQTHQEQHQLFLPKRREAIEHLFIPKEV